MNVVVLLAGGMGRVLYRAVPRGSCQLKLA